VLLGWLVLVCLFGIVGAGEMLDIDGRYQLDVVLVPIPATLVGEIQLDSPAELTVFKTGVESTLDLSVAFWDGAFHLNTAMNIAGLERVIVDLAAPLGPIGLTTEIWLAVPFETVTDINHFTNWVVVPPGDLMFVDGRITAEIEISEITFKNLLMIEDVTFPDPALDFVPLQYPVQDQSFHIGDILLVTSEPYPGVTVTSTTLLCASLETRAVKGWSATGSVDLACSLCDDFCFKETLGISGLEYCGVSLWFNLTLNPLADPALDSGDPIIELSGGGSMSGLWSLGLTGSFSLLPLDITGFSFSTTLCDVISASIQLGEDLNFESASLRSQVGIDTGIMQGSTSATCTIVAGEGVTSLTLGASLTHGTISGGLVWAFVQDSGSLRLGSVTSRFRLDFAPASFAVSVAFGRSGLVQAAITAWLSF